MKKNTLFLKFLLLLGAISLLPQTMMAQWQKLELPGSEPVFSFASHGDTVFAAAASGVYRNIHPGLVWEKIFSPPQGETITGMFSREETLLVVGEQGDYLSENWGLDWAPFSSPALAVEDVLWFNGYIFVSDYSNLYRGDLPGVNWTPLFQSLDDEHLQVEAGNGVVWMAKNDGLFRSTNNGDTWETVNDTLHIENNLFVEGDTIFAGGESDGAIRSTDGGTSWTYLPNKLAGIFKLKNKAGKLYAVGTHQLFSSDDLGSTWNDTLLTVYDTLYGGLFTDSAFLIGATHGCIRSNNQGENWGYVNSGFETLKNTYFELNTMGNYLSLLSYAGPSFFAEENSSVWVTHDLENINGFIQTGEKGSAKYGLRYHDGIYVSTDDVTAWTKLGDYTFPYETYGMLLLPNDLVAYSTSVLFGNYIHYLPDGGQTWFLGAVFPYNFITAIADTMFTVNNGVVQRTSEFGNGWQTALCNNLPSLFPNSKLGSFGHSLYVMKNQDLYLSEDHGDNWTNITESLEDLIGPLNIGDDFPIFSLAGILYPSNGKLYLSEDKGETWQEFMEGIEGVPIGFKGVSTDNGFYLLTVNEDYDYTYWKRDLSDTHLTSLSGVVYADTNGNGIREPGESAIPQAMVRIKGTNQYTTSHANGAFKIVPNTFPDTLCLVPPCLYCEIIPQSYIADSTSSGLDFGVHYIPGIKDLSITATVSSPFVPGFDRSIVVTVKNIGTTSESGEVNFKLDPSVQFTGADPSVSSNTADSLLTWTFNDLAPMGELNFNIYVKTLANVQIGSVLHFTTSVTPLTDDHAPQNNEYIMPDQIVVGSYDPNDKQVEPSYFSSNAVANSLPLNYTVRFQNTGNFPASFVTIVDTLSQNLDFSTFKVLSQSHPMTWSMRSNGIVKFKFENINLPDSASNELGSHGFVKFSIQAKPALQIGAVIPNEAAIYFDYNAPVFTNTTLSEVEIPVYVQTTEVYICEGETYMGVQVLNDTLLIDTIHFVDFDSVYENYIHLIPKKYSFLQAELCAGDSIFFNNQFYSSAGTYQVQLTSALGCDSTVVLDLIVHPSYLEFQDTLYAAICEGGSYVFAGQSYTLEGLYHASTISQFGCDSTVVIQLAVNPVYMSNLDTVVTIGNSFLGVTILQDTAFSLPLQTAVGCDSIITYNVKTVLAANELSKTEPSLRIYPNPASNEVFVEVENSNQVGLLQIFDSKGRVLEQRKLEARNKAKFDMSLLPSGIYWVQWACNERLLISKLVIWK